MSAADPRRFELVPYDGQPAPRRVQLYRVVPVSGKLVRVGVPPREVVDLECFEAMRDRAVADGLELAKASVELAKTRAELERVRRRWGLLGRVIRRAGV